MLKDFRDFIMRGNVIDLAIAVVIGGAFKSVVDGFVNFIVMPIVGIIGGKPTFDDYLVTINGSQIRWGAFVSTVVSFLIIAATIFVIVRSYEALQARRATGEEPTPAEPLTVEGELLAEIRDLLKAQQAG